MKDSRIIGLLTYRTRFGTLITLTGITIPKYPNTILRLAGVARILLSYVSKKINHVTIGYMYIYLTHV